MKRTAEQKNGKVISLGMQQSLQQFIKLHGVTKQDIDDAFDILSSNKETISRSDIKRFVETYFDNMPEEAKSFMESWKDVVRKEQMELVLLNRTMSTFPFESAFKV